MANRTRDTANLVSANNLYVDISTDKVGIGTTTPTSKLTVVGDVLVSGILTASHIVGTSLSISGISTLGITSTTNLTTQQLNVSGLSTFAGITTHTASLFGTQASFTGVVTASSFVGNGAGLTGLTAVSAGVTITANTTNQSQFLTYVTETGNVSGLGVTTTGLVFNPSTNSLGIGTATPRANLDVVGTSLITGISTIANFIMTPVGTGATVGGIGVTYYGDGSQLSGVSAFSVQQQSITASPVYPTFANGVGVSSIGIAVTQVAYIPASGNLGIGTTNPTAKLDVRGDVSIASTLGIGTVIDIVPYDTLNSGTLSWEGSAGQLFSITNNLTTGSIYSVNDVSGIPSIDVDANGTIQLGPYGGNIGLGTTNPIQKLHVIGNVLVSGVLTATRLYSSIYGEFVGGSISGTNIVGTSLSITGISTFTNGPILVGTGTSTGTSLQRLQVTGGAYVSGNLGIGTTNPTKKLDVNGTVKATYFSGRGATSSMANYWARQTWTSRTNAVDNSWTSVAWSKELGLFAAVSSTGSATNRVMTSPNGITWTSQTSASGNNWRGICWAAELGLFVAVAYDGGSGNRVMTSPDGTTWTTQTQSFNKGWQSVCWSPQLGRLVSVSNYNGLDCVMYSPDGINWTITNGVQDNTWNSVCWSPELGLFVAVSGSQNSGTGSQRVMTSTDGINWSGRTAAAQNDWMSVCWSPELGLFAAVSISGIGNRVMTSPDGINWTSQTSAADNQWFSVCWAAELGLFVAVSFTGSANRVMTSPDGIKWTIRTSAADHEWLSVCWSPEQSILVAVSQSGTLTRVMTSP